MFVIRYKQILRSALLLLLFIGLFTLPIFVSAKNLDEVSKQNTATYTFFSRVLHSGSKGQEVNNLQILFHQFEDLAPKESVTGEFTKETRKSLKRFQRKYGLKPSGRTDRKTRIVLNKVASRFADSVLKTTTKSSATKESVSQLTEPQPTTLPSVLIPTVEAVPTTEPYFTYKWRASKELTGETLLPTPAPKPVFILDGIKTITPKNNAAVRLAETYRILLVDEEENWSDSEAGMFLEMLRRLPKAPFETWRNTDTRPFRVSVTDKLLPNDVEVNDRGIRVTRAAFARSNPTLQPSADGSPDRVFYSNRLFRVVLRAFYSDRNYMSEVIRVRYGLALGFGEPADEFQEFTIEELQYLASVFEDLPDGFRGIPGLEKIVRRKNGLRNPFYPDAAAIAWIDLGYMEFMDVAFKAGSTAYIERIIAHEITHFLWAKVLSPETRKKFRELSGWSKEPGKGAVLASLAIGDDHPKSSFVNSPSEIWYRTTTTNFVSGYAAAHNPDEDFAETLAYYIYNSDFVRTIAPEKYNFIKEVVDGYEYVILVDEKFTFQVFNLEPNLAFPGKIVGIDTEVYKLENGDNRVIATLHLSKKFGDGAEQAYARIVSPAQTYLDQYFLPVNDNKFLLRTDFTVSKYAAHGYWIPEQIEVHDKADNRRYEGQTSFGWLLFINNPEEDLEAPIANIEGVKGTLTKEGDDHVVRVTIPISDKNNVGLGAHGSLQHYETGHNEGRYREYAEATQEIVLEFPIRKYRASGNWAFRGFTVFDKAGNERLYDLKERELTFFIETAAPDYEKPTLDISAIKIKAAPKKPEAPDGETDVSIWYAAKDDSSGLGIVTYTLLKPNGDDLFGYNYHDNFYTEYFVGDPTELKKYKIEITLPPGSIPGTWILRELVLYDKAGNILRSNFVEIGILKPFKVF